jgi:hypothetical protein
MADRGTPVPDADTLHRVITPAAAAAWFPNGLLSSAAFSFPVFSVDIARLSTPEQTLARWPVGSGIVGFNCGQARQLGFDARHEPEHGNGAHANVYNDFPTNERKRRARQLAAACAVVVAPVPPRGDAPPG